MIARVKAPPRFKVGDRVRVVRLLDSFTVPALVGGVGRVAEVDDVVAAGTRLQVNYVVKLDVSGAERLLHDEELDPA